MPFHKGLVSLVTIVMAAGCFASKAALAQQAGSVASRSSADESTADVESENGEVGAIIVTARKRSESIVDVPVSVTALSGDSMDATGLRDLQAVTKQIPNLYMDKIVAGSRITMRGLGSSSIGGVIDPSVGLNIDGVTYPRPRWMDVGLFDIERVEALRGPQSTYFGKGTTAGLLNITTRGPGSAFDGYVQGGYEIEHHGYDLEGATGGPINDSVGVRIAYRHRVVGGYLSVIDGSPDLPRNREDIVRLTAQWDPINKVSVVNKLTIFDSRMLGDNIEIGLCSPVYRAALLAANDPDDCFLNFTRSPTNHVPGGIVQGDFGTTARGYSEGATATAPIGALTLTSVTAFHRLDNGWNQNAGFTLVPTYNVSRPEEFRQFSEELRIQSPQEQPVSFFIGSLYADGARRQNQIIDAPAFGNISLYRTLDVGSSDYALFGEITGRLPAGLELVVGGRYAIVRQHAQLQQIGGALGTLTNPLFAYDARDRLNSNNFSPSITLQYRIAPEVQAYASYKKGFKAGGFDLDGGPRANGQFHYGDEKARSVELGVKASPLNGRVYLSADVFDTKVSNMQVESYPANGLTTLILNAASATLRGVEFEGNAHLTRAFSVNASFGYTDARYDRFPNAPCALEQPCTVLPGGAPTQDLSGRQLPLAPRYTAAVGFDVKHDLSRDYELKMSADLTYRSSVFLTIENSPLTRSDPVTLSNGSIEITPKNKAGPGFAIVANNIFNKLYTTSAFPAYPGTIAYAYGVGAPRSVECQLSYKF
jgi:iron complex outermembrane receptor protein